MTLKRKCKDVVYIFTFLFLLSISAQGQEVCPAGKVCIDQQTANRLYDVAAQLVEAKTVINRMLEERGASDAALASANRVIDGYKQLQAINDMQIAKYKDVTALYEQTVKLYVSLVENLEKRLSKPKSAWAKFLDALKNAAILLAGVTLGRGL